MARRSEASRIASMHAYDETTDEAAFAPPIACVETPDLTNDDGDDRSTNTTSSAAGLSEAGPADVSENESQSTCARDLRSKEPSVEQHNVIILDYDDTILPTSFLSLLGLKQDNANAAVVPHAVRQLLDSYSLVVARTLAICQSLADVYIVTNAEHGWVQLTARAFLPCIAETLTAIPCISARSTYEPAGYTSPFMWKEKSFESILQHVRSVKCRAAGVYQNGVSKDGLMSRSATTQCGVRGDFRISAVSIGDSNHEREAMTRLAQRYLNDCEVEARLAPSVSGPRSTTQLFKSTSFKSVKLLERPDLQQLGREHILLQENLAQICSHGGNLDICIQPTVAPVASSSGCTSSASQSSQASQSSMANPSRENPSSASSLSASS